MAFGVREVAKMVVVVVVKVVLLWVWSKITIEQKKNGYLKIAAHINHTYSLYTTGLG